MQLGRKIRDLRLRRGLTVQKLAEASHLSKGFISQVENARTSPSLGTLRELAAALHTSVAYLLAEDHATPHVVRAAARPRLRAGGGGSTAEVLSAQPRRNLEMILLEFPPGPPVREAPREHPGEACVLCLEGRLRLRHAGQEWILETGDTCHFDCRAPHTLENAGPGAARALLAMTPAAFGAFLPEPEAGVTAGSPGRSPATG